MSAPRILFFYCQGGGGHVANYRAFCRAVAARGLNWHIDGHNIYDVIESNWIEDVYNACLRKGYTWHWGHLIVPLFRLFFSVIEWISQRKISAFLNRRPQQPDVIITNIQVTGLRIATVLQSFGSRIPLVVFINDHGEVDDPDFTWGFDARKLPYPTYFLCPNESTRADIQAQGHAPERVLLQGGVGIDESFLRRPNHEERCRARKAHGLSDGRTVAISFGGAGSETVPEIVRSVSEAIPEIQFVVLCGRDERTRAKLEALRMPGRMLVKGYVDDVATYLALGDVFVGKPGPGSLSEAVSLGLAVVTVDNHTVMNQEKKSLRWIREQGLGEVVGSLAEVGAGVQRVLEPQRLARIRENGITIRNTAMEDCIRHVAAISGAKSSSKITSGEAAGTAENSLRRSSGG